MLDLDSSDWSTLSHAYGDASDVPGLLSRLKTATDDDWTDIYQELMSAIMHQGDVYTATYAAAPHLLQMAADFGPCRQSDELLESIGYAARGGVGPEVPESLEEDWEDTQTDARDLILERLADGEASEEFAGLLIGALLFLSGEWQAGKLVTDWCWGTSVEFTCQACSAKTEVFWHHDRPHTTLSSPRPGGQDSQTRIVPVSVEPNSQPGTKPDPDLDFEPDELISQILGLAVSTGHARIARQFQMLFGTVRCSACDQPAMVAME